VRTCSPSQRHLSQERIYFTGVPLQRLQLRLQQLDFLVRLGGGVGGSGL
jgi:hypothetical protein